MRVQPCSSRPLRQRQHCIFRHVDIGKLRSVAGSKFMLSNCDASHGLTTYERVVAKVHGSTFAASVPRNCSAPTKKPGTISCRAFLVRKLVAAVEVAEQPQDFQIQPDQCHGQAKG